MNGRLFVALVFVAVTLLGGYGLYGVLFPEEVPAAPAAATVPTPQMDASGASAVDAEPSYRLHLLASRGAVEVRTASGPWRRLAEGVELSADDAVRTGDDGEASFGLGEHLKVTIPARSGFTVGDLSAQLSNVRLDRGRIAAAVQKHDGRFEVAVRESDARVRVEDGQFAVLRSDSGRVTVATQEGSADFEAQGKTVSVSAGTQSVAEPQAAPGRPIEIPASLFLKVRKPTRRIEKIVVRGSTSPGTVLSVEGAPSEVDPDGRFTALIEAPKPGEPIVIEVTDALGRRAKKQVYLYEDRTAPKAESEVTW